MTKTILFIVVLFFSMQVFGQLGPNYNDESRRVYWFDVNLKKVKDPETLIPTYQVYRSGTKIQYGTAYEYDRYLWQGLSNGTRIAIGPFDDQKQAVFANKLYDMKKALADSSLMSDNGNYFWYLVTIKKTQRLKSYDFERIPAQINSGNASDFVTLMKFSLPQDKLVIGPFLNAPEAENSKRVFRLEE
ncbi:MAG: hypothetical protein JXL97_19985 [Bacteroidales bacterium]|nr:hypothetical protein [Bacteroidales bacterium]